MTDPITRLNAALEGRYRVGRQIGEGGMAVVYLDQDERHNRNVALKVLKLELAAVVGAERLLAEIRTTANLQHPHILPLHDFLSLRDRETNFIPSSEPRSGLLEGESHGHIGPRQSRAVHGGPEEA